MQTLVKEQVRLPEECEKSDLDLAKAADELLGYGRMKKKIEAQLADSPARRLIVALNALDVRPFTQESVQAYKEARISNVERPPEYKTTFKMLHFLDNCMGSTLLATIAYWIVAGITAAICNRFGVSLPVWAIVVGCVLGGSFLCALLPYLIIYNFIAPEQLVAKWVRYSLDQYKNDMPEFALQTAVDIKKRCPEANFIVEEFDVKKRPKIQDPFLIVFTPSGQEYYIEVWGEKEFSKKRPEEPVQ
ncbi:MAG: hypothetical protein M0R80_01135 [Proteobacteria bacterium]|jgi:hypothetical protein|nr:hypothetical protein [Pseudomonadota bacterium]